MKVLLIEGAPAFGGQARNVYNLAVGLRARGHDVAVTCHQEQLYSALKAIGVATNRVRFTYGLDWHAIAELRSSIVSKAFDIVHTHGLRAGTTGRIAARLAGCDKIVHTAYALSNLRNWQSQPQNSTTRVALRCTEGLFARWTDTIIAVSEDTRLQCIDRGVPAEKVVTIHPGIDLSQFEKPHDKSRARNKLMIPIGCQVVGTVGCLTGRKNLIDFVRGAKIASKKLENALFVMIGSGPEMVKIKSLANELGIPHKIILSGFRSDIPEVLSALDVFVGCSLQEGYYLAVLEAMAAGLPVIVNDIAGMREAVLDGFTGHVVPPSDPESLAAAIEKILTVENAAEMGAAGKSRANALYSLDRMVDQVEKVYKLRHR